MKDESKNTLGTTTNSAVHGNESNVKTKQKTAKVGKIERALRNKVPKAESSEIVKTTNAVKFKV